MCIKLFRECISNGYTQVGRPEQERLPQDEAKREKYLCIHGKSSIFM